jgi:hypothetical protein
MAVKNQAAFTDHIESWIAEAAIEKYDAVMLGTVEGQVLKTSAITDICIGFALNAAAIGMSVDIQRDGVARGRCSAALVLGVSLQATADGEVVTVVAATTTNVQQHCVGVAASATSAANEIVSVVITPHANYTHA